MPIGGSATELNITGAKLKVSGGIQVAGSIAYTTEATGFGSVTAQIDNDNTLNITSGKNTGVAKIERSTAATITAINHTNVNNNTTIHIALKNTSSANGENGGIFITLGTFSNDDNIKVNYTDDYVISPQETGMITLRKVNNVLSVFIREMFTTDSKTFDSTKNRPFYVKDGTNYKYPLYTATFPNAVTTTIGGTQYYVRNTSNGGVITKTRPPLGLPDNTPVPSGTLKIGNNLDFTTINYDVYGTGNAESGSLYRGTTQKVRFGLDVTHNEASGSFTDSGVSSGDTYTLYLDKTPTTSTDTASTSTQSGVIHYIAFHYGTFANSGNPYSDASITAAASAGHVYSDTSSGTYTWGTLGSPSSTSSGTTYTWTPSSSLTGTDVLMVAGGGGGGGNYHGGGGGGGGLLHHTNQSLSGQKTIVIGAGGSGGSNATNSAQGNNTTFTGFDNAIGGGTGGGDGYSGGSGGSGGGGSGNIAGSGGSATSGQGNSGGSGHNSEGYRGSGGGGGAGGAGGMGTSSVGGTGGNGADKSSVFGTTYGVSGVFAGGGGGGVCCGSDGTENGGSGGGGHGKPSGSFNGSETISYSGTKHTGGGGGGASRSSGLSDGGDGGSGIVVIKYTADVAAGKNIAKVTGISFTSSNIVFTVQQDSGNSITHVKYTINGGSEVSTAVGTLSVAHSLSAAATISVVAWAVDTSGNQLGVKKTVSGTVPS